jgi:hypothetical protein
LDKGHPVHQISQAKKNEVSKETREKARAMAEEALAQKLEAIDMSDKEWKAYQAVDLFFSIVFFKKQIDFSYLLYSIFLAWSMKVLNYVQS